MDEPPEIFETDSFLSVALDFVVLNGVLYELLDVSRIWKANHSFLHCVYGRVRNEDTELDVMSRLLEDRNAIWHDRLGSIYAEPKDLKIKPITEKVWKRRKK